MVRDQAVRSGLIKADDANALLEQDILNLIFEPGFSTASEVTEISGRGVGMDVVRTVLDRLKGTVQISSAKGKGTTIQLRMPLTLASIQTLLFRVSGRLFAVPLSSVIEITRINEQEIHRVDQREVLRLRDQVLTLVRLSRLSRIHAVDDGAKKKKSFVVVIGQAEKRFGLLVDSMVGEEELVIKALPGEIVASDLVSGASILGDGTVVLNPECSGDPDTLSRSHATGSHRMRRASPRAGGGRFRADAEADSADPERDPDIEVVGTAMDGAFALKKIAELQPDVVTLDLEMPRMDGIETLRTIMRNAPLPVIVFSTHSREGAYSTFKALALGAIDFVAKAPDAAAGHLDPVAYQLARRSRLRNAPVDR